MKEIIEKYKSRKLTVSQCYGAGVKMDKLDVVDLYLGDTPKSTRMTYDELTTNFSNTGAATVVTCLVLDKLIIDGDKTSKQPKRYKYEKVEFKKLSDLVLLYENGEELCIKHAHDETKPSLNVYGAISAFRHNDQLYRRIELTSEQLHERKVEELAIYMRDNNPTKTAGNWSETGQITKEPYLRNARLALEWMESKGK